MFEVEVSHEGSVRTIGLIGECDLQMFPDVDALFSKSLDNGFSAVRIDLRGLTFIDSSGIRALMLATRQSQTKGAKLDRPRPPEHHAGVRAAWSGGRVSVRTLCRGLDPRHVPRLVHDPRPFIRWMRQRLSAVPATARSMSSRSPPA